MANETESRYQVTIERHTESPTLTPGGRTAIQTTVVYSVGTLGTYTLIYPGRANAAQIAQDVTARVNELKALDQAVTDLNQQTSTA